MDLSSLIRYYRYNNYKTADNGGACKYYKGNDQCERATNGCFCRKMAEVLGNISYVVPKEHRGLTINNLRGHSKAKDGQYIKVWTESNQLAILDTLSDYLYGTKDLTLISSREDFNRESKLDQRYADGSNLVIHGSPFKVVKGVATRALPMGKTLIASIVLTDAIWRRCYATNRADTYSFVSYQTLKQDLRLKNEKAQALKECDWLAIDDISTPINDMDFNHQNFISMFDDFLMSRMENRLPTILACDFNALSKDYTDMLGYSFQKLITSRNTWLIKVGD